MWATQLNLLSLTLLFLSIFINFLFFFIFFFYLLLQHSTSWKNLSDTIRLNFIAQYNGKRMKHFESASYNSYLEYQHTYTVRMANEYGFGRDKIFSVCLCLFYFATPTFSFLYFVFTFLYGFIGRHCIALHYVLCALFTVHFIKIEVYIFYFFFIFC